MEHRSILQILEADGQMPDVPEGMIPAIKFVNPDWTTHGGYRWPFPGQWTGDITDSDWNPKACHAGGVHVATTVAGAQSGGAKSSHCVVVAYRSEDAGHWDNDDESSGKLKVRRALSLAPVDLWLALRRNGTGADLDGAHLDGAYLAGANFGGANFGGAYLYGANLYGANLDGANLARANFGGAYLDGANLTGANLDGANLYGANLTRVKWNNHTRWPNGYTPPTTKEA